MMGRAGGLSHVHATSAITTWYLHPSPKNWVVSPAAVVGPAEAGRCANWSRTAGLGPIWGAGCHNGFLRLLDWPLPWTSDLLQVPEMAPRKVMNKNRNYPTRVWSRSTAATRCFAQPSTLQVHRLVGSGRSMVAKQPQTGPIQRGREWRLRKGWPSIDLASLNPDFCDERLCSKSSRERHSGSGRDENRYRIDRYTSG